MRSTLIVPRDILSTDSEPIELSSSLGVSSYLSKIADPIIKFRSLLHIGKSSLSSRTTICDKDLDGTRVSTGPPFVSDAFESDEFD